MMNLAQFMTSSDVSNWPSAHLDLGFQYTPLGRVLHDIQAGRYEQERSAGWNLTVLRRRDNIVIVKGTANHSHWVIADKLGYSKIIRVYAVVDSTTHNVLSYYALTIEGTYDEQGKRVRILTRTITGVQRGGES